MEKKYHIYFQKYVNITALTNTNKTIGNARLKINKNKSELL